MAKSYTKPCAREEMIKAEDMGEFYRVPADNPNYAQYYSEETDISKIEDYHSHNTEQLGVEGMKKLLVQLPLIKNFGEDVAQMPG
jgi:UDP-glucose 4-epimerase